MSKPERVGPVAGLLALVLLVVNLVATRESPTPDTPTALARTPLRRSRGERNGGGVDELAGKTLDQLA